MRCRLASTSQKGAYAHSQRHGNRTENEFPLHMNVYHSLTLVRHSTMLKKSASLSCSFGLSGLFPLFGLSRVFG